MKELMLNIERVQKLFRERMVSVSESVGLTEDIYSRILSMEYHLTNGVQRHFFLVASHPLMSKKRSLRKFLFDFANEEELHYQIAHGDLENLGRKPDACPLDVKLWKAYFDSVIFDRPFLRLGATCILENIANGSRDVLNAMIKSAKYLNESNTRFIVIHQHGENIPHGEQILEALSKANPEGEYMQDLVEGSRTASILFLRMIDWCISGDEMKNLCSSKIV